MCSVLNYIQLKVINSFRLFCFNNIFLLHWAKFHSYSIVRSFNDFCINYPISLAKYHIGVLCSSILSIFFSILTMYWVQTATDYIVPHFITRFRKVYINCSTKFTAPVGFTHFIPPPPLSAKRQIH